MPVLDAQKLRKRLGDRLLLDDIDLTIALGEKVGVVGSNGAGKSTLARILAGELEPDGGELIQRRGTSIAYLAQDPTFPPDQTVRQCILSGRSDWFAAQLRHQRHSEQLQSCSDPAQRKQLLERQAEDLLLLEKHGGWEASATADRFLSALGLERPDQLIGTLSGGERRRVGLGRLLFAQPDLAILDEPTNHLDAESIEWLERYLSEEFHGAAILITHDRWLLSQVVDRTIEVDFGKIYSSPGGWPEFLQARAQRLDQEQRRERNRQNFLRQELEWLRRQPKARTGKQKARVDRAEAALSAQGPRQEQELSLTLSEERLGSTILEAKELSVEIAGQTLVEDLTLHLTKKSRLGVVGPSGVGKTTLLRTLLGELSPSQGQVTLGKNTKIAYLDQLRSGLREDETVFDAVTGGHPTVTVGETTFGSHSYLQRFHFRGEALRQKVAGLSGGERARVALARLLQSTANVLVLDEPTNDLDVMTLGALEELILGLSGAAIIVSHDRYFLDKVATSVLALEKGGSTTLVVGGFSNYLEHKKRTRSPSNKTRPEKHATEPLPPPQASPKLRKLTYAEEIELKQLPERIEQAGLQLAALEAQLNEPAIYSGPHEELERLQSDYQTSRSALEELEQRWLSLEERREAHQR